MVKRNANFQKLIGGYLFPEVRKRVLGYLEKNPSAQLINLSIGDTSEPLSHSISSALNEKISELRTKEGYTGYGPEQGIDPLRQKIASIIYQDRILAEEIFVSDGAKCDIGRLQILFGNDATIAVQDPSYPVYVDSSVIIGQTGPYDHSQRQYKGIIYLPCLPENGFFPDLEKAPITDLIYFCSPNNPTGVAATHKQLQQLVLFAKRNRSCIIYDAAYSHYITDNSLPKSIYEIEGAKEVAIEVNSFSKMAGFTGVRLSWTVIPNELLYDEGISVKQDWLRLVTTLFNGASNISQAGGLAALSENGLKEIQQQQTFYLTNAHLLKSILEKKGYQVFGGVNTPFLWVKNYESSDSWILFEQMLEKFQIVTTPGSGFGPGGDGFLRFSAFGSRSLIENAIQRLDSNL